MSIDSDPGTKMPARLARLLTLEALGIVAIFLLQPPAPVHLDAPVAEFSSGRAMKHVAAISQRPHPVESEAHQAALDYILGELKLLGIVAKVDEGTVNGFTLRNVIAKLPGTASTGTVLLSAHYDSVDEGPGAGDDAAGVAAILETLRALKQGPALRNDVMAVITDGEELGLLGAKLFVLENPLPPENTVVLNFEARGNWGPSIMFETSEENGSLVAELARAAPHLVASSLSYAVYRLLPNDTDVSVFKNAGFACLNFAFIDGVAAYHDSSDTPERLSERTLQHHGSYAYALARHFGGLELPVKREPNAVYFNVFGSLFVRYPGSLAMPITLCVTALYAWCVARGLRSGKLTWRGLALGLLVFTSVLVVVAGGLTLVAWLIQKGLTAIDVTDGRVPWRGAWANGFVVLGISNAALALTLRLYRRRKRLTPENGAAGAMLFLLALLWCATIWLEGATFLLAWPMFFALVVVVKTQTRGPSLVLMAPAAVLLWPTTYLLFLAMASSIAIAVLVATVIAMLWIALMLPLLDFFPACGERFLD